MPSGLPRTVAIRHLRRSVAGDWETSGGPLVRGCESGTSVGPLEVSGAGEALQGPLVAPEIFGPTLGTGVR